jgi:hypothetical protein
VWPRASFVEGREHSGRLLRHLPEVGPDHVADVERVCENTEAPAPSDVAMPEVGVELGANDGGVCEEAKAAQGEMGLMSPNPMGHRRILISASKAPSRAT